MKKTKLLVVALIYFTLVVLLCSCAGPQGEQGPRGEQGPKGDQGIQGEAGDAGTNGKTPEYRENNGWVQWKYTDEPNSAWKNLYAYGETVVLPDSVDGTAYISTVCETDQYGLAGSYTMLYNKKVTAGERVSLTATVNNGYNFEGWYINDTCISTEKVYDYVATNQSVEIEAKFSSYEVNTSSEGNVANVAGTYTQLHQKKVASGDIVNLTATVNEGYNFEGWYINDVCVSRALNYTYTMEKSNVDICAKYSRYSLTVLGTAYDADGYTDESFAAGTYTQYTNKEIAAGTEITLTATVNDGYNFVGWYIGDTCIGTNLQYTFTMEKQDVVIHAAYVYYKLNTSAKYSSSSYADWFEYSEYDFATVSAFISPYYIDEKVSVGESITVTAVDIEGYTFIGWGTWDAKLSSEKVFTFNMPSNDFVLVALYK